MGLVSEVLVRDDRGYGEKEFIERLMYGYV